MDANVVLRPGRTPLADWRAVFRGAAVALDPFAQVDVEAGRAALASILAQNGLLPPLDKASASPSIAELIEARGEILPDGELRLFAALKLAALAQGASGVRWEIVQALAALLESDFLPVAPESANDRLALSHLFAALTGAGEVLHRGRIYPAAEKLRDADLHPVSLNPRERSALLSGTELTLARTLAALFTAERVFQSTLVSTALSSLAANNPDTAMHLTAHRLHRQRGQLDVATALRALAPERTADASGAPVIEGTNADRSAIFRAGAALDLLRQAAILLERAANSVSEDRLVLWQSEEMVSGVEDTTSLALAADLMSMALATLGALAAARIAASADSDSGGAAARAASLATKMRENAGAPALDPAGIKRLPPLVDAASKIVAIEFLEAARREETDGDGLADVLDMVRRAAPKAAERAKPSDRDIRAVAERVRSGALAAAADVPLPSVVPLPPERARPR